MAKGKTHKAQHFIPQSYLKAWCDPAAPVDRTPYVWIFNNDRSDPRKKAPIKIFCETDMYTIFRADGERDLSLEHGLDQLENNFASVRTRKLAEELQLSPDDHVTICAFMAAMCCRTPARRDWLKKEWQKPLELMDQLRVRVEAGERLPPHMISPSTSERGLTYEDVKRLVKDPLQNMLAPTIATLTPMLCGLDLAVLTTKDPIGFITSDNPCVWWDSEAYKRPPMFRSPGIMYPTIEIGLPVSPRQYVILNRAGINGYFPISV
jgi:hypothetical protein